MHRVQRGITFIGFILMLLVAGCFAYVGMLLVPMYTEYYSVVSALKRVANEPGVETMDPARIHNLIGRGFNVSYVETIDSKDVKIVKDTTGMRFVVDYEVRKHVVYNIDLVGNFQKTIDVGGKTMNGP
jgi:hypothetical protein